MAETKKIYSAMVAIMKETEAIAKDSKNLQQGYSFRGIDSVYNNLHPILAKNGVFCTAEIFGTPTRETHETKDGKGKLLYSIIDYKISFVADDGSSVSSIIRGEGMDSGDKGSNKALSAAMKYACMLTFLIPTEDIAEAEKESPEPDWDSFHGVNKPAMKDGIAPLVKEAIKQGAKPEPAKAMTAPQKNALLKITGAKDDAALCKAATEFLKYPIDKITDITIKEASEMIAGLSN